MNKNPRPYNLECSPLVGSNTIRLVKQIHACDSRIQGAEEAPRSYSGHPTPRFLDKGFCFRYPGTWEPSGELSCSTLQGYHTTWRHGHCSVYMSTCRVHTLHVYITVIETQQPGGHIRGPADIFIDQALFFAPTIDRTSARAEQP